MTNTINHAMINGGGFGDNIIRRLINFFFNINFIIINIKKLVNLFVF